MDATADFQPFKSFRCWRRGLKLEVEGLSGRVNKE
jgi:hypothetical protein